VTVWLVKVRSCDDGCYETEFAFTSAEGAAELARRLGAEVEPMETDKVVRDVYAAIAHRGPDGPVRIGVPHPGTSLPANSRWGVGGVTAFGWSAEEAEATARAMLRENA
jgi:hypothetical protein